MSTSLELIFFVEVGWRSNYHHNLGVKNVTLSIALESGVCTGDRDSRCCPSRAFGVDAAATIHLCRFWRWRPVTHRLYDHPPPIPAYANRSEGLGLAWAGIYIYI